MAKMIKPEVKAVRFGGADVIATSGLSNNTTYVTLGRELNQEVSSNSHNDGTFYQSTWGTDSFTDAWAEKSGYSIDTEAPDIAYAWYNASTKTWGTAGILASDYTSNSYPTGND